ncbi:LytS/YhcK type 5TM receptor domain-containing protein [Chloroflexota bacterium]
MEVSITDLILDLIEKMSMVIVVAYLVTRTRYFSGILDGRLNAKYRVILILFFGGFALYGTYSGIELPSGAIANVRDLAPIAAGIIGGPLVGLGAGLIGGVHRYFLGGLTNVPCALATVIAGLAAGLIFKRRKEKPFAIWQATLFAVIMESLHMCLILLISRPYSEAVEVVKLIALPMILANAVGVTIFALMARNSMRERNTGSSQ